MFTMERTVFSLQCIHETGSRRNHSTPPYLRVGPFRAKFTASTIMSSNDVLVTANLSGPGSV